MLPPPPRLPHNVVHADAPEIEIGPRAYAPGDVIASKYQLTSILGEGGMGSVWLARNLALDMDVAVKLIRSEMSTPETEQRLLVEARATARLGHPSIVRIFDFGETEFKDPFIVMEVLNGESLADVLDRVEHLPAENAVQTILPIASALAAVHGKGIIHRDLKPENIVLTTDDAGGILPKIVDFGIAKLALDGIDAKATRVGAIIGSPDYLSPEQARGGENIDERVDVWALAVVLYEAITGAPPFQAANYHALLRAIIEDAPKPTTESGAGDEALWRIIERGLAKDPARRWPSMRAFGKALAEWAIGRGIGQDIAGLALRTQWLDTEARSITASLPSESDLLLVPPSARTSTPDEQEWQADVDDVLAAAPPAAAPEDPRSPRRPPSPLSRSVTGASSVRQAPEAFAPTLMAAPAPVVAQAPPSAHLVASEPPLFRPRRSRMWIAIAAVGALAGGAYVARDSLRKLGAMAGIVSETEPGERATAGAADSAPPPASAAAAPAPSASASAAASNAADVNQCAVAMFPDGTFLPGRPPKLSAMCGEIDPRRGAAVMKEIVRASRHGAQDGMHEWALLGPYEMAAFAVVRAACCTDPPPLDLPAPAGSCPAVDDSLNKIGAVVSSGKGVDPALQSYAKAVDCAVRSGAAKTYGFRKMQGGEETEFRKTLKRALASKGNSAPSSSPSPRAAPARPKRAK